MGVWNFNQHRGRMSPQMFEGHVKEVNADKKTFTVITYDGYTYTDIMIPSSGGYALPNLDDYVGFAVYPETGYARFVHNLPQITVKPGGQSASTGEAGKQVLVEKNPDTSRAEKLYIGHEFTKEAQGKDFKGSANDQRFPIREGDKVIFDSAGGAHMLVNKTGDASLVVSDVLQEHWIKQFDQRKSFWRRREVGWPGGVLKAGDYKQDADRNFEEDMELSLFATAMDYERTRWDLEFGKNVKGATKSGDDKDVIFHWVKYKGDGSGKNPDKPGQEKKRYERTERSNGSYEETWFDSDGAKKRFKVKFDTEKDKKLEVRVYNADEEKAKVIVDLATGAVDGMTKDTVKFVADRDISVESKAQINLKAGTNVNFTAGQNVRFRARQILWN